MALLKNKISVPFAAGLETKSDTSQSQLSGLRVLENVIFDTPKKLLKRNGYSRLETKRLNGNRITTGKFLTSFEDELGLMTDTNYFGYSDSIDKWSDKGRVFTAFPESKPILRNNVEQKNTDVVSIEGINVFTFEDSEGVKVSVVDASNCNFLLSNELISASGVRPMVVNISNIAYIFYIDGTDLKFRKINILFPQTIEAEQTFTNDIDAVNLYDCVTIEDRIFVAYQSSATGGVLRAAYIDSGDVLSSFITFTGESATNSISTAADSSNRFLIAYADASELKATVRSFTLAGELLAPSVIEAVANISNVTVVEETTENYRFFYEITAASVKDHFVRTNTIAIDSTLGTSSVLVRSAGLASKGFRFGDLAYVTVVHQSTLQSTYFVLDSNGTIVTRFSSSLGGDIPTENVISKVNSLGDSKFVLASQIKGRTVIDDDQFFSLLGVNSTELDFDLDDPFQNEVLGRNLHIAGGIPMMYDGEVVVEHGFHIFPEDLSAGSTSTVGGSMGDGEYQYAAVYAWTDNKGLIHRSAPSIGLSVTLSGATATQQQDIVVPTLRLTQKENVIIELYRTEAAGTVFYKVTDVASPQNNDKTIDTITINDTTSDADLIDNEILYTTGGILDNIAAPSSSIIESFSDRIFLAGLEEGNTLQYSKIRFEGAPVEFNDILTIAVNSKGGDITALKAMDEKLIIFKESAIFYLSGDGPNNAGQQDTFIKPELVSSDIGCININSVVLTPSGLMFKSRKGIYLLTRQLQLTYIGANVEEFNDLKVSSAVVIPEENQVRFTTEDGDALVFNYFVSQWATFTNHKALSAVAINFDYYYLRLDGTIYQEDTDSFTDNGTAINMKLRTGWVSFAGVQGFQRVYKLLLLGEYKSPHKIRVRVAYDFREAFVQEVTADINSFTDNTRYGDYSPYGEPTDVPYGSNGNQHQIRVDLKRQKCQSIRIQIEEIQNDEQNFGEGLRLSNIMFEVGEKRGVNKIDTAQKFGTS